MFNREPVSSAFGQTTNLSEPKLQYPPPGDSLANYFPEASELSELTEKGITVAGDKISSDVRSESASKARRSAMAKRVGFIPTDP